MVAMEYLKNVSTLELTVDKCNGCSMCLNVCPHAVLVLKDRRAFIARPDACMECGACVLNCEQGALTVNRGVGCAAALLSDSIGFIKGCDC
ncbi:4Fe-4S binding protein [Myxococcota bacterium]|nr:4Fe-4S binding protein [Myxococcota bacterium]MBU1537317.1 4Fe-4S binding protein [Myxococcota bacterium]